MCGTETIDTRPRGGLLFTEELRLSNGAAEPPGRDDDIPDYGDGGIGRGRKEVSQIMGRDISICHV